MREATLDKGVDPIPDKDDIKMRILPRDGLKDNTDFTPAEAHRGGQCFCPQLLSTEAQKFEVSFSPNKTWDVVDQGWQ